MLKKLAWFLSILLISACFFSFSVLEYSDRNIFLSNKEKEWYHKEEMVYKQATEMVLFKDFPRVVRQIQKLFETYSFSTHREVEKILAQNEDWLLSLSVRDARQGQFLFSSKTSTRRISDDMSYPCVGSFYYLPEENHLLICENDGRTELFLHISQEGLKNRIVSQAANNKAGISIVPLRNFFLQKKEIYLNISPSLLASKKQFIDETKMLLLKQVPFHMYWDGIPIVSTEILDLSKGSHYSEMYNFYYRPVFSDHPLTGRQIFFIAISSIFGLLTLLLGYWAFFKWFFSLFLLRNYRSTKKETTNTSFSSFSERDYPELRNLIAQVANPSKTDRDPEVTMDTQAILEQIAPSNSTVLGDLSNSSSLDFLLEKYPEILCTLNCIVAKDEVHITLYSRSHKGIKYGIPQSRFLIPDLSEGNPDFYIYKEAGKTSAIRFLLNASPIDPQMVKGALVQKISDRPLEFHIYLLEKMIEPDVYKQLYFKAKSL